MTKAREAMRRLKVRAQFVNAARGVRTSRRGFALQMAPVAQSEPGIGYTVTKKAGNSPERNRIKRRLRAAVAACADVFEPKRDYVLIGRREALHEPFDTLVTSIRKSAHRLNTSSPTANKTG